MKKKITQKEAKEKYGILMSHLPEYNKFFLLDDGRVVDSVGDTRYQPAIHYGDYGSKEDEELIKMREELMDYIEKSKTEAFINKFHELLEVERELTLREDK